MPTLRFRSVSRLSGYSDVFHRPSRTKACALGISRTTLIRSPKVRSATSSFRTSGGVGYDDVLAARIGSVNGVVSHAVAGNDFQIGKGVDELSVDPGATGHATN